jgi:hypothetical protein
VKKLMTAVAAALLLVAIMAMSAPAASAAIKVNVCHKPGTGQQTLNVSIAALFGHLGHGDYLGACQAEDGDGDDGGSGDEGGDEGGDDGITPSVLLPSGICSDGLPPDAGKDGWVPASGNTNDECDHSGDPRLNDGVDTRTREW